MTALNFNTPSPTTAPKPHKLETNAHVRLLFITHGPLLYGAQMSLLALLTGIDRNLVTPFLVSPREGPLTDAARRIGIQVFIFPVKHWVAFGSESKKNYQTRFANVAIGMRARVQAIVRLIDQLQIDLVYTNTVTVIEGALAARSSGRPHIWHLREHVSGNADLKALCPTNWLPHIVGRLSTRVIVNSRALARSYACKSINNKITVIHNGIDLKHLQSVERARDSLGQELDIKPESRIIATIGSLTRRKGLRAFIDSAAKLSSRFSGSITFLVVGDGDRGYRDELASQVKRAGLEDAFRFVGWRNDIPRILSAIDLLLVTAEQEAFGRTVIEAMAARVPVVATQCGGPEEIILDGTTGYLVPVNDSDAIACRAAEILSNPSLSRQIVEAAHLHVRECFSIDSYVSKIEAVVIDEMHRKAPNY